jgi:hypothetical protein
VIVIVIVSVSVTVDAMASPAGSVDSVGPMSPRPSLPQD